MSIDPHSFEPEQAWIGTEDLPIHFANTFSGRIGPNAIFIDLGSMMPPAIESEEDLEEIRFVPVKPIARLALAPGGLDDLIKVLQSLRRNHRALLKAVEEGEP
jgi:hypothetical protein